MRFKNYRVHNKTKIGGLGFKRKIETVWKESWKKTHQKQLASSDIVLLTVYALIE